MAIKLDKKEKIMAILKYYIILFVLIGFEYLIAFITSSELVSILMIGIYFMLVRSDFDYSVLIFNLFYPSDTGKFEKVEKLL